MLLLLLHMQFSFRTLKKVIKENYIFFLQNSARLFMEEVAYFQRLLYCNWRQLQQYSILHLDLLDRQDAGQVPVAGGQLLLLVLLGSDQDESLISALL